MENFPGYYLGFTYNAFANANAYWKPIDVDRAAELLVPPLCGAKASAAENMSEGTLVPHGNCAGMRFNIDDATCQCDVHATLR